MSSPSTAAMVPFPLVKSMRRGESFGRVTRSAPICTSALNRVAQIVLRALADVGLDASAKPGAGNQ